MAALESYIALTASSIIDTIEIEPKNILVVDDWVSEFEDNVAVTFEDGGHLKTEERRVTIKNTIWDGESLMDVSMFGAKYEDKGMLLLRNRFFKSCCFNANIQEWFKDHGVESVDQLRGFTLAENIADIKLITTPSSIKYVKFGSIEQWLANLNSTFGIVKYEKPTHFFDGKLVQAHYQLINTLELSEGEVEEFLAPSFD